MDGERDAVGFACALSVAPLSLVRSQNKRHRQAVTVAIDSRTPEFVILVMCSGSSLPRRVR